MIICTDKKYLHISLTKRWTKPTNMHSPLWKVLEQKLDIWSQRTNGFNGRNTANPFGDLHDYDLINPHSRDKDCFWLICIYWTSSAVLICFYLCFPPPFCAVTIVEMKNRIVHGLMIAALPRCVHKLPFPFPHRYFFLMVFGCQMSNGASWGHRLSRSTHSPGPHLCA